MSIEFGQVKETLVSTEEEVAQYDQAVIALGGAKEVAIEAQGNLTAAQVDVTEKTQVVSSEEADVVAGIQLAISQLTELLAGIQG